jgi:hypothetical protein
MEVWEVSKPIPQYPFETPAFRVGVSFLGLTFRFWSSPFVFGVDLTRNQKRETRNGCWAAWAGSKKQPSAVSSQPTARTEAPQRCGAFSLPADR